MASTPVTVLRPATCNSSNPQNSSWTARMLAARPRTQRWCQAMAIRKPNRAARAVPCQAKARVLASARQRWSVEKKSGARKPWPMRSSSLPGEERVISRSAIVRAINPATASHKLARRQRAAVVLTGCRELGLIGRACPDHSGSACWPGRRAESCLRPDR